jgi:DNA-binding NtrC family response regulator
MHSATRSILVIDDDKVFCDATRDYLANDTRKVQTAYTGTDALSICSRNKVDVVLLDQKLPDGEGVSLCPSILKHNDQIKIIFITAYPSLDNAVKAVKMGAYDYLSKPFELEELGLAVERALRTLELERIEELQCYKDDKESEETVLVSGQGGLAEALKLVDAAASTGAPTLITGETGTGKSVVARSIHYKSSSYKKAFICINCAAFPESLIEAELFGYEKGAFTGAVSARKGIFELAEGGTLFLDEIGAMPLHLQSKLLGVLEEKKIRRIGGESIRPVDVRIIAASNADLEKAIESKTFREDLFYRLSVIRIHIPPLRERRADIPALCDYFIHTMAAGRHIDLPDSEMARLMEYNWPGNVRELKNIIERSLIIQKAGVLRPSKFLSGGFTTVPSSTFPLPEGNGIKSLEDVDKNYIRHVFTFFSGNYTRTARALGISLSTLKRKVKSYGLVSSGIKVNSQFKMNHSK